MANTNFSTTPLIGLDLSGTSTTPQFALGTTITATNGTEWTYVQAGAAITAYDYVCIDSAFLATSGTKANVDKGYGIGFAQFAFASGEYGFVARRGVGLKVNALTLCLLDAPLYTTATAGAVDDTTTSQTLLRGITLNSTVGGATAATSFKAFTNVFA